MSFGNATTGVTPPPVSERVTVVSNNAAGYAVSVHRTAFQPADLPLGIAGTAPTGGQIGGGLAGGTMAAIPVPPAADLLVGTTAARSAAAGDVWDTRLGFVSPLAWRQPVYLIITVSLRLGASPGRAYFSAK